MEKVTFELPANLLSTYLDACSLRGLDPDITLSKLIRHWLEREREILRHKPKKGKQLAKVLRVNFRRT